MPELDNEPELIIITSENEVTLPDEWIDLLRSLRKHSAENSLLWSEIEDMHDS